MTVIIGTEARFWRASDGSVRSETEGRSFSFWCRYLAVFESVVVFARVTANGDGGGFRVDGPGVSVWPVADYLGFRGLVTEFRQIKYQAARVIATYPGPVIGRLPGPVSSILIAAARRQGVPYGAEVVGDPKGVLASGAPPGTAALLGGWTATHMRRQCRRANAVAYVTREFLQHRYPASLDAVTAHYSSVELNEDAYARSTRTYSALNTPRLITIGSVAQRYKGVDVLVSAVAGLASAGTRVELRVLGEGRYLSELWTQAHQLGVDRQIQFLGRVSMTRVRKELDEADLFVLASRTEGLPRALLEAMARALPAVGTGVGGIPELLDHAQLVSPNDSEALADAIAEVIRDPPLMTALSRRNLAVARDYSTTELTIRRDAFYRELRAITLRDEESQPD